MGHTILGELIVQMPETDLSAVACKAKEEGARGGKNPLRTRFISITPGRRGSETSPTELHVWHNSFHHQNL